MAYKPRNFTDDLMLGISSFGKIGDAINDKRQTDAAVKASDAATEANNARTANEKSEFAKSMLQDSLTNSIEGTGKLLPGAMEGKGPGNVVNADEVQTAKKLDQEAQLWNSLNKGREGFQPMTGKSLLKGKEDKALAANQADQKEIVADERETTKIGLANKKTQAETTKLEADAVNGKFTPIALVNGGIGKFNTKTGNVEDTGEKGAPKAGAKNAEFNALPMESQEQVKKISQTLGFQKTLRSSIASDLEQFKAAKTPDAALSYGLGMLKALNSTLGPDALSNDESERLGAELKLQLGNWRGPGKFAGRDLAAFVDRVQAKVNSLDGSIKRGNADIDALYGRQPAEAAPAGDVDLADPRVKEALANGYTIEQIKAHLGKK